MKREFAKIRAACRTRVIQYVAKIQAVACNAGNRLAVDRIGQNVAVAFAVDPLIQYQVSKLRSVSDCTVSPVESKWVPNEGCNCVSQTDR